MSKKMIEISNLRKVFKVKGQKELVALDNINLTINQGEIFGIIGLSGAGKTTLVRCINMLEKPTAGSITIDGVEVTSLSPARLRQERRNIGMVFQHFNLLSSRTVFGNVAFPLEIAGVDRKKIRAKVLELLELVGLSDKANAYPAQLSGGQKQRVGIARALANDPKVLLCDEATSALDPYTTRSILKLLRDINQNLGITIVLITHEMHVIKEICDRVAVMDKGRIVEQGQTIDVFTAPQTETARRFVSSVVDTEIPQEILKRPHPNCGRSSKLVRVSFLGRSAGGPIISAMVRQLGIDVNILFGNIDQIKDTPFAVLLLELSGPPAKVAAGIRYLEQANTRVEVINKEEGKEVKASAG